MPPRKRTNDTGVADDTGNDNPVNPEFDAPQENTYAPPDERVNTDSDPLDNPHDGDTDVQGDEDVTDEEDPRLRLDVYEGRDGYGQTNHALTEDEVRRLAEREGTLREDGRPKAQVFWDDLEGARVEAERNRIEAIQFENTRDEDFKDRDEFPRNDADEQPANPKEEAERDEDKARS
jgi:hypothetical protein